MLNINDVMSLSIIGLLGFALVVFVLGAMAGRAFLPPEIDPKKENGK